MSREARAAESATQRRAAGAGDVRRSLTAVWLAAGLVLAGCGEKARGAPVPPAPTQLDVTMREYRFDYENRERPLPRGRFVLRARNAGALKHELLLVGLPEDLPPIAAQVRSATRRALEGPLVKVRERRPGAKGLLAVDLGPGRYAFLCFVTDPDGEVHARKGMTSEFRVR